MENAGSQNPHPRHWRVLYRSAVLETNNSQMAKRLSEAREAIAKHMRELFRETGADVDGQREAMNDAMYALEAIRVALELKTRAA